MDLGTRETLWFFFCEEDKGDHDGAARSRFIYHANHVPNSKRNDYCRDSCVTASLRYVDMTQTDVSDGQLVSRKDYTYFGTVRSVERLDMPNRMTSYILQKAVPRYSLPISWNYDCESKPILCT